MMLATSLVQQTYSKCYVSHLWVFSVRILLFLYNYRVIVKEILCESREKSVFDTLSFVKSRRVPKALIYCPNYILVNNYFRFEKFMFNTKTCDVSDREILLQKTYCCYQLSIVLISQSISHYRHIELVLIKYFCNEPFAAIDPYTGCLVYSSKKWRVGENGL